MSFLLSDFTGRYFVYNSFKNSSSLNSVDRLMSNEPSIKPKRVLTEAQRLAFLKGRETRMANLEKKRLEKEEALFVERVSTVPETKETTVAETTNNIEKPKLKRQKKPVDVKLDLQPISQTVTPKMVENSNEKDASPEQPPSVTPIQAPTAFQIDEDKIAEKVANHVYAKIASSKQPRKSRNPTKQEPKTKPSIETVKPHAFTWI